MSPAHVDRAQTEVHRVKITKLFRVLDSDRDDVVVLADYVSLAQRIAGIFGHPVGSRAETRLQSVLRMLWHVAHDAPVLCRQGKMTLPQMLTDHHRDILNSAMHTDVVRPLSMALLAIMDPAGTGRVSSADVLLLIEQGFGVSSRGLQVLLPESVTYATVHRLVVEFFFAEQADAPGNFLLGALTLDH